MRKLLIAALPLALCAAQAPDAAPDVNAMMARLLDTVRANDETAFAPLVGGMEEPRPADPANGPVLGDYGATPPYYGPLTLASMRRFAMACRYEGPDPNFPAEPLQFGGRYSCNGEAGHTLNAQFSLDGRRAVWITIMTPADHRALAEQGDRIAAQDAVTEAARQAEEGRIAAVVDALFAAAREGDQARFRSLLGRGELDRAPFLSDERWPEPRSAPLTVETLRRIAATCRRTPGGEIYQHFDQDEQIVQEAPFTCDDRPARALTARFERNGTRISWLRLEGVVARPLP